MPNEAQRIADELDQIAKDWKTQTPADNDKSGAADLRQTQAGRVLRRAFESKILDWPNFKHLPESNDANLFRQTVYNIALRPSDGDGEPVAGFLRSVRPDWNFAEYMPHLKHAAGCIAALRLLAEEVRERNKPQPLTPGGVRVYEMLCELPDHKGMTGPEILNALAAQNRIIDQSTLTKRIIPELKPWGLANRPRVGYYIEKTSANSH